MLEDRQGPGVQGLASFRSGSWGKAGFYKQHKSTQPTRSPGLQMKASSLMNVIHFVPLFGKNAEDEGYVRLQMSAQRKRCSMQVGQSQFNPEVFLVWNQ